MLLDKNKITKKVDRNSQKKSIIFSLLGSFLQIFHPIAQIFNGLD
jgi:hypothetical protein